MYIGGLNKKTWEYQCLTISLPIQYNFSQQSIKTIGRGHLLLIDVIGTHSISLLSSEYQYVNNNFHFHFCFGS